jgi:kynureninase
VRTIESHPIAGPSAADVAEHLDDGVGLVSLSQVAYRSGAIADMDAISTVARAAGAFTLWDLSHSAGAIPVELSRAGADLAVGCTYKYLNGGPGAPAFVYVRSDLQDRLQQPVQGWYSHNSQFDFDGDYTPAPDIRRFLIGTPPILSMVGAVQGIELCAEIGIDALRRKSKELTGFFIDLYDQRLAHHGFSLVTPRDAEKRGSHVTLTHEEAYRITKALIEVAVVPDYRDPGAIRFGIAPSYTSAAQVWEGVDRLVAVMDNAAYESHDREREKVT